MVAVVIFHPHLSHVSAKRQRSSLCCINVVWLNKKNRCTAVNCRLALDLNQTGHFVILVFFFLHHDHIVPQATTQCSCQVTSVEEAKKHFSLKLKTQTCICRHKLQGKQILVSNFELLDVCWICLSRHFSSLTCEHLREQDRPSALCMWRLSQNKWKKQKDVKFKCNHVPKTVKFEPCTYWNVFLVVINFSLIHHFCCFAFVFSTWIIMFSFNTMVATDYSFASAACSLFSRISFLYEANQNTNSAAVKHSAATPYFVAAKTRTKPNHLQAFLSGAYSWMAHCVRVTAAEREKGATSVKPADPMWSLWWIQSRSAKISCKCNIFIHIN